MLSFHCGRCYEASATIACQIVLLIRCLGTYITQINFFENPTVYKLLHMHFYRRRFAQYNGRIISYIALCFVVNKFKINNSICNDDLSLELIQLAINFCEKNKTESELSLYVL